MELRAIYGAGFGLMSLGYGLGVVESLLTSVSVESMWLDGLMVLVMGLLAWQSLAGELDGLNDDESSVFLRPFGYVLVGIGMLLTVLNGYLLTPTLL